MTTFFKEHPEKKFPKPKYWGKIATLPDNIIAPQWSADLWFYFEDFGYFFKTWEALRAQVNKDSIYTVYGTEYGSSLVCMLPYESIVEHQKAVFKLEKLLQKKS